MLIRTPADLGAVVRDRRKQLGLDQAELATRIGVSRQWVVGIEHGRSRAELGLVLRTLDVLGVRLDTRSKDDKSTPRTTPDIDAIVSAARKDKR
jgi:HTH-type transcriptional regulator / antitoxin HipB